MWIVHRKKIRKLTFRALAFRRSVWPFVFICYLANWNTLTPADFDYNSSLTEIASNWVYKVRGYQILIIRLTSADVQLTFQ